MANLEMANIHLVIRKDNEHSHIEDQLVFDGANVSRLVSVADFREHFQMRTARSVIADCRFG